jgi:metal-responsive CopG/Arc/MetJ family transcriptional regulator
MSGFVLTENMGKRRKKRGRPRTGHDPMVGLRLPAATLRKIDKFTEALSRPDRSATLRFLIDVGIDQNSWLLRSGKGRGVTGRIVMATAARVRAVAAEHAAEHGDVAAEIKAQHERERAEELASAEADRIALARAARPAGTGQSPRDTVKAAVDRAVARSRRTD